jgi:hypothetical protein
VISISRSYGGAVDRPIGSSQLAAVASPLFGSRITEFIADGSQHPGAVPHSVQIEAGASSLLLWVTDDKILSLFKNLG